MLPRNADSLFVNIPRGSTECMFKQSETWETMRYYILPALLSVLLFCWMLMKCPTLFYTLTEMDVCVLRSVSSPLPAFFFFFFFFWEADDHGDSSFQPSDLINLYDLRHLSLPPSLLDSHWDTCRLSVAVFVLNVYATKSSLFHLPVVGPSVRKMERLFLASKELGFCQHVD